MDDSQRLFRNGSKVGSQTCNLILSSPVMNSALTLFKGDQDEPISDALYRLELDQTDENS